MSRLKYIFSNETVVYKGFTLRRIRAVRDMSSDFDGVIKSGEIGGWIESEENLSHSGSCWVHLEAKVYGKAKVFDDARVTDQAVVCENAVVSGEALVAGSSCISEMPTLPISPKLTASRFPLEIRLGWGASVKLEEALA